MFIALFINARVFTTIQSANAPFQSLLDSEGTSAYSSSANINQSEADLKIISFNISFTDTLKKLKGIFGVDFAQGGTLARATIAGNQFVTRLIVINLGDLERTLVFAIRQNKDEYLKSKAPLVEHLLTKVPAYPGSTPISFLGNDDTSFSMETSEVIALPATVQAFYVEALASSGWTTGIPLLEGQKLPSYMTWIKKKKFCSVYANTNPDGKTTISVIYKELGK